MDHESWIALATLAASLTISLSVAALAYGMARAELRRACEDIRVLQADKADRKDVDDLERDVRELAQLATTVAAMARSMEHMGESVGRGLSHLTDRFGDFKDAIAGQLGELRHAQKTLQASMKAIRRAPNPRDGAEAP
jgi:hypothetical protein